MRHLYLRNYSTSNKHPVGCLAVELDRENNVIRYAFSTCAPQDKFDSSISKSIAYGRLKKRPVVLQNIPKSAHEITLSVMQDIIAAHSKQQGPVDKKETDWRKHRHFIAYEAANSWLTATKPQPVQ